MSAARLYFTPIPCMTGALHQQPPVERMASGSWCAFTADYEHCVDLRGAIDAPDCIPTGSVRAQTYPELTLGVAHTWRGRGHA